MIETCKRELFEETGLKIDGMEQKLVFFGNAKTGR